LCAQYLRCRNLKCLHSGFLCVITHSSQCNASKPSHLCKLCSNAPGNPKTPLTKCMHSLYPTHTNRNGKPQHKSQHTALPPSSRTCGARSLQVRTADLRTPSRITDAILRIHGRYRRAHVKPIHEHVIRIRAVLLTACLRRRAQRTSDTSTSAICLIGSVHVGGLDTEESLLV